MPVTLLTGKSVSETFSNTRQTAISKRSNALERLAERRRSGDRVKAESLTDAGHFDEFVNEVTVRGRLLHLQTEQDDVLAERESFP